MARQQAAADAELVGKVTQHWFRHLFATKMLRLDPRAAMEQAVGSISARSWAYAQDVPEHRRSWWPKWTIWRRRKQHALTRS